MRSFALELGDVDVALDEAQLPHRCEPFDIQHVGNTVDLRKQHVAEAMRRLGSARLLDGDRMDADVENTLRVWTSPDVLIMVRVDQTVGQQRLLYRAASARDAGVVSQLADGRIEFEIVQGQRVLATMVGELPPLGPIPDLRELTVPLDGASNEVAEEDFDPLATEAPTGTAAAQQREMRAFAQWPVERFCGFELWVRGRSGLAHMGTAQVVDTEGGRYVMLPSDNQDLRILPSNGSHLQKWLRQRIDLGQDDR